MIPILMQDDTTVGFLKEAMSCVATEEQGGVFELSLTYPVTGVLFDKLQIDWFIKAKSNGTADLQMFRIYEVTKRKIWARTNIFGIVRCAERTVLF